MNDRTVHLKGNFCQTQALRMATLFDGISLQLDFTSCGEEGSSSDNSSDDYTSRIHSPRVRSPSAACRTPRVQRHHSRRNTVSSPLQCTSPIPYASWRKLRLCDSPSTPKVENESDHLNRSSLVRDDLSNTVPNIKPVYIQWNELHFICFFPL